MSAMARRHYYVYFGTPGVDKETGRPVITQDIFKSCHGRTLLGPYAEDVARTEANNRNSELLPRLSMRARAADPRRWVVVQSPWA